MVHHGSALMGALIAALVATPTGSAWTGPFNGQSEPSTSYDTGAYIWQSPPQGPAERVYFSGNWLPLSPDGLLHVVVAYFGFWRDCDRDGYIGSGAAGVETYPTILLLDDSECPAGSQYNSGGTVTEFRWIGPGSNGFDDPTAQVWMDWLFPGQSATSPKSSVDEELQFDTSAQGPRWHGSVAWVVPPNAPPGGPAMATFYGKTSAPNAGGQTPSGGQTFAYGSEHCPAGTGNWTCAQPWTGNVDPGEIYHVRDVDCYDASLPVVPSLPEESPILAGSGDCAGACDAAHLIREDSLSQLLGADSAPAATCDPCRDVPPRYEMIRGIVASRVLPVLGLLDDNAPTILTPILRSILVNAGYDCDPSGGTGGPGSPCPEVITIEVLPGTYVRVGARAVNSLAPGGAPPAGSSDTLSHCAWTSADADGNPIWYLSESGVAGVTGAPDCFVRQWLVLYGYPIGLYHPRYDQADC